MSDTFPFDFFHRHSSRDKAVARPLAEQLLRDKVKVWFDEWVFKPGDSILAQIEKGLDLHQFVIRRSPFGFEQLRMSANASGSDWAQLESGTFRFRVPLNRERRFTFPRYP